MQWRGFPEMLEPVAFTPSAPVPMPEEETDRPRLLVIDPSIVWPEEEGVAEVIGDWPGESRILRPAL